MFCSRFIEFPSFLSWQPSSSQLYVLKAVNFPFIIYSLCSISRKFCNLSWSLCLYSNLFYHTVLQPFYSCELQWKCHKPVTCLLVFTQEAHIQTLNIYIYIHFVKIIKQFHIGVFVLIDSECHHPPSCVKQVGSCQYCTAVGRQWR